MQNVEAVLDLRLLKKQIVGKAVVKLGVPVEAFGVTSSNETLLESCIFYQTQ